MKKTFTLLACVGLAVGAWAIPARPLTTRTIQLSDGSSQVVTLRGDETFHYYTTPSGQIVRENEDGSWGIDTRDVQSLHLAAQERRRNYRRQLAEKVRPLLAPSKAGGVAANQGAKKGLLILVNFSNLTMKNGDRSNGIFQQMLNGIGNPYGQNYGSVREFFRDQSYGQFDIEFDVIGPVTVSREMAYYGKDSGGEGNDQHPGEMIKEACRLADSQVNFADYDWDGDGEVENIYVTYAGYGQASGASSNTIWPHQWALSEATGSSLRLDGVKIDTYACGSELYGTTGSVIDGIGTMCHEYSHCLGLPDFYDTGDKDNFGMGPWSLMDYGCYNGDGFCPAGYTSYERWFAGWIEPTELSEGATIDGMKNIEENPEAYIIYNDANHNEYYLLENHQLTGWDKQAYGHGLLVVHVDYDRNAWYNNTVNNTTNRQRMTIIPADNSASFGTYSFSTSALAGDPFPGQKNKKELTDESTPKASLYRVNTDGTKFMHKPITDISETNGLISFQFMGGAATPVLVTPPEIDSDFVEVSGIDDILLTARWGAVEHAVSYNLSYSYLKETEDPDPTQVGEAVMLREDFGNLTADYTAMVDGSTDVSTKLDNYTQTSGWTGSKVYVGLYGAKLGSARAVGFMTTPQLRSNSGELTVFAIAYDWVNSKGSGDGSTLDIILQDVNGRELQKQNVPLSSIVSDDETLILCHFTEVPTSFKVCLSTTAGGKRVYLAGLVAFDGNFSEDEVLSFFDADEAYASDVRFAEILRQTAGRRVSKVVTNTVTGITDTFYTISGLPGGITVTYKVQAVDENGKCSDWSNPVDVTLPVITAIKAIRPAKPWGAEEVYDLAGRRVDPFRQRKGIYVQAGRKLVMP